MGIRKRGIMVYYLYVKTHNQTGLKYLGQSKKGKPSHRKGKKLSIEHRKNLSESHKRKLSNIKTSSEVY